MRTVKNTMAGRQRIGKYGKRIIRIIIKNGREYQYHATKGWRSYRLMK